MNKLCIIFILTIIILYLIEKFYNFKKYTIICARYNKNTDFLNILSKKYDIKIIQKNIDGHDKKYVDHLVINKANEATSYLSYIIKYYDNLPDNMIFIHDENESWHHEGKITNNISKWINEYKKSDGYYELNTITNGCTWCYKNKSFKELWKKLLPNKKLENHKFDGKCCAQFIISKKKYFLIVKNFILIILIG